MAALDPSLPLCVCGIRGCDLADQHQNAFVVPARGRKGNRIRRRTRIRST